ncbi:hypothetical protein FJY84_01355 [Candidatus Bathyarchaeota archaeon]|nr:hypothetical protein [Candidatus Bathyarchaeota archaeon]
MIVLRDNRLWDILWLVLFFGLTTYYMSLASKGKGIPKIRTIAALEAIVEGVGRAVEIRKPVHFSFGSGGAGLTGEAVSETVAGVGILSYSASATAKLGARLIMHLPNQPESIPLLEGTIDDAYLKEGKVGEFDKANDLRFYGTGMMVFAAAASEAYIRDGCALKIMVGRQNTLQYVHLEAAKLQGAIVVGGTTRWTAMYIFALTCDYMMIGEEVFAAGAKVTENPYMLNSLQVEEYMKYFSLAITALAILLRTIGVDIVSFFRM